MSYYSNISGILSLSEESDPGSSVLADDSTDMSITFTPDNEESFTNLAENDTETNIFKDIKRIAVDFADEIRNVSIKNLLFYHFIKILLFLSFFFRIQTMDIYYFLY